MDPGTVMNLIEYVDSINVAHGATEEVYSTETAEAKALARRALGYDLHCCRQDASISAPRKTS